MAKKEKVKYDIKEVPDDQGNFFVVKKSDKSIILSLKLKSKEKQRKLGVVSIAKKQLVVRRNRAKHLMRVNESYGFSHKLLEAAKTFENVKLIDDTSEWLIPVKYILAHGVIMNFQEQGFERQIFIQLATIEHFKKVQEPISA